MKAILCTKPGGPDDLQFTDIPDPVAGPGEAVVRVAAAGLNFFDTLIIADRYQVKPPRPFSPAFTLAPRSSSTSTLARQFPAREMSGVSP